MSALYVAIGAYSNKHPDIFSFTSNQAALAKLPRACVGVYAEKRFLLDELSFYEAAIGFPTHSGNFGLDARYAGFSGFNETLLGLTYARNLGGSVDLGVQFNYYALRIPGYGNASSVNFEIGTMLHLTDNLNFGLRVYNPTGSKLGKNSNENLPAIYSIGVGFEPSQNFLLTVQIDKEENIPANVTGGLQYKFLPQLVARLGISALTSSICMGFGFEWRSMRLDATASFHPQLGLTPGIMLLGALSSKDASNTNAK